MKQRRAERIRVSRMEARRLAAGPVLLLGFLFSAFLAACGAPGEPQPPSPPIPVAVADLSARQVGDGANLVFTLPSRTTAGERLAEPPAVEVLRGSVKPDGAPDLRSLRVVEVIPGALVPNYATDDHVHLRSAIPIEDLKAHPGMPMAFAVRTRASAKRASADSNVVIIAIYPPPERISAVQANVTETAVVLTWQAPHGITTAETLAAPLRYNIYRGEIAESQAEIVAKDLSRVKWTAKPALQGSSDTTEFRDTAFQFGKLYVYIVRSAELIEGKEIESEDSTPVAVKPADIFPPAAPQGVTAAVLPGPRPDTVQVELSWSINSETDLAGYYVYRSEQEGTRGARITPELLLAPAIRDTSVQPGHRYWYTVTALDRAGNESAPSTPLMVNASQPSP